MLRWRLNRNTALLYRESQLGTYNTHEPGVSYRSRRMYDHTEQAQRKQIHWGIWSKEALSLLAQWTVKKECSHAELKISDRIPLRLCIPLQSYALQMSFLQIVLQRLRAFQSPRSQEGQRMLSLFDRSCLRYPNDASNYSHVSYTLLQLTDTCHKAISLGQESLWVSKVLSIWVLVQSCLIQTFLMRLSMYIGG